MKKAKLILTASMFALMGMSVMSSCSKDAKVCDAGYEGSNCDVQIRTPMLGTYNATDTRTDDQTVYTYSPSITINPTVTIVNISNFGDFFSSGQLVTSNITKSGNIISFSIPVQQPANQLPGDTYSVQGSGSFDISTKKIAISYSLTSPSNAIQNYTGNWTMQ